MREYAKFFFGVILAPVFFATPSFAADAIDGFGPYKFGMSVSQVKKLGGTHQTDRISDTEYEVQVDDSVAIGDRDFSVFPYFVDKQVAYVALRNESYGSSYRCSQSHIFVYGALKARYGEPDIVLPSMTTEDVFVISYGRSLGTAAQTRFWLEDGSRIDLFTRFYGAPFSSDSAGCLQEVTYRPREYDERF